MMGNATQQQFLIEAHQLLWWSQNFDGPLSSEWHDAVKQFLTDFEKADEADLKSQQPFPAVNGK